MPYEKELAAYFAAHREEFLKDLQELIAIPSTKGAAEPESPFGAEPAQALACALQIAQKYGLYTENLDNYVGIVQLKPGERKLDILAHLDVVPADGNWTVTDPFNMKVWNGKVYGRGTADDKGPALAALYALRAIRELQIPLSENVRLVLGTDEECGSADLAYYFRHTAPAEMSFSPDADYPVINIERGRLAGVLGCPCTSGKLVEISAGNTVNIIPEKACVILKSEEEERVLEEAKKLGISVSAEQEGALLRVTVHGIAAHAASPEAGNNPVTALLALLADHMEIPVIQGLAQMFPHGDIHGEKLGIDMADESGRLTISLTCLELRNGCLTAKFDCRVPICGTEEKLNAIRTQAEENGFTYQASFTAPHHVPEDSKLVQTLRSCYEQITGRDGTPIAIGGGTYAHGIPNAVAFGCAFPEVDNHMHGNDEFAELDTLELSQRIFAQAVIALCGGENT